MNEIKPRVVIGAAAALRVLMICCWTQGVTALAVADGPQSTTRPPCSLPWDITKRGTVVDQEFAVSEQHSYSFDIEFHHNGLPPGWGQFIGSGGVTFFTKDVPPKPAAGTSPS